MSPRAASACRSSVCHPSELPLSVPDGTGNPRLPSHTRPNASQAPPSRGWHVASCRPGPHCRPQRAVPQRAAPARIAVPSVPSLSVPPRPALRPLPTAFVRCFALAIHQNASFGGRQPFPERDLPRTRPFLRVPSFVSPRVESLGSQRRRLPGQFGERVPSLLDQVQLYQLDLVQRVWSTGLSVAEVLDLVQHKELDLVQAGFDGR